MMKRDDRFSSIIFREISLLLHEKVTDPRINPFVTITRVELRDRKVYVYICSQWAERKEVRKTLKGLRSSVGYIKYCLGKSLSHWRYIPNIFFMMEKKEKDTI